MGEDSSLRPEEKPIFRHNPWIWIGSFGVLILIALGSFVFWVANKEAEEVQTVPSATSTPVSSTTKSTSSSTESINSLDILISDLDKELVVINEDINSNDDEKVDL